MKTLNTYKRILKLLFLTVVLSFCVNVSFSQPALPQHTLKVSPTQAINFGTFYLTGSALGTISVGCTNGVKPFVTGGIEPLFDGRDVKPAIFAIKLCQGRRVIISFNTTYLTCNGKSLELRSGPSEFEKQGEVFTTNKGCDFVNILHVGGTLKVPGGTPAGEYNGDFEITLNQE